VESKIKDKIVESAFAEYDELSEVEENENY